MKVLETVVAGAVQGGERRMLMAWNKQRQRMMNWKQQQPN
jgi:hypothetical protein